MVTGLASAASSAAGSILGVAVIVVIAGWALMFAVMFGLLIYLTVLRGRRQRRQQAEPGPVVLADPNLPAILAQARQADPHFDERLLLDSSQLICLILFATVSTGDEDAVRQLAAPAFWSTFFGRYTRDAARSARLQRVQEQGRRGSRRQARLPVDYQAQAPELISLDLRQQRACVRVSFSQLRAVVAPGAAGQTAMASATSLTSLASSFGGVMSQQMSNSVAGLSWLSWAGKYDLVFTRPPGARTDPRAAIANRTCSSCGATYRSELATSCEHCHAERPTALDTWRLADVTVVD
jgi:hypothetical protein